MKLNSARLEVRAKDTQPSLQCKTEQFKRLPVKHSETIERTMMMSIYNLRQWIYRDLSKLLIPDAPLRPVSMIM